MNGVNFDISDDNQFRMYCVQQFGILADRTKGLEQIKVDVPLLKQELADVQEDIKDEKFWNNVKAYSGPILVGLHVVARKIGINI